VRVNSTARLGCVALALVLAGGACGGGGKKRQLTLQEMITADPLPLAKGAKWTYTVNIKKFDPDTNQETTRQIPWTTEVLDAREQNGVTAFRVRGWPTDLMELDGNPTPTERTILRSGNSFLFGATPEPNVEGAEGWFTWPVIDGQKICPKAEMVYCWQVAAVEGGYALSFYTGPDEQTFELEPGTGVARFHYAHHGTTNEVEAKLVSYTKGR
jgi:hypothetical protein